MERNAEGHYIHKKHRVENRNSSNCENHRNSDSKNSSRKRKGSDNSKNNSRQSSIRNKN